MNVLKKYVFPFIGYGALFVVSFLFFAYLTFPYDRVRDYIVQEVENPRGRGGARAPSGYRLAIVSLSPSFFTGVSLSGVNIEKVPEADGELPVGMTFEEVNARVSLLSALTGDVGLTFDTDVAGGHIEGETEISETETMLRVNLDGIQLRRAGLIRAELGLPVLGAVSGDIDMTLNDERENTNGHVQLAISDLKIGDGRAKLKVRGLPGEGVTIAQIDAGQVDFRMNVEEGVGTIEQLRGRGEHILLDGDGAIQVSRIIKNSVLDMLLRVKFEDAYAESSDRAETMMSLLRMHPRIQRAAPEPGTLQYAASGPIARITWTPAKDRPAPGSE